MEYQRKKAILDSDKVRLQLIGQRVLELREATGLTVESFCMKNRIPRISYTALQNGSNFHMTTLLKVLDAHKIRLDEFFMGIH